jgi:hypothetical protein
VKSELRGFTRDIQLAVDRPIADNIGEDEDGVGCLFVRGIGQVGGDYAS